MLYTTPPSPPPGIPGHNSYSPLFGLRGHNTSGPIPIPGTVGITYSLDTLHPLTDPLPPGTMSQHLGSLPKKGPGTTDTSFPIVTRTQHLLECITLFEEDNVLSIQNLICDEFQ